MTIDIMPLSYQKIKLDLQHARSGETKPKILANAIRADIEQGLLEYGLRLPPQRRLADNLSVSLQTISSAYQELERQGYVRCETGRGSFVSRPIGADVDEMILDRPLSCGADFSNLSIIHTEKHDRLWRDTCLALSNEHHQPWIHAFRPMAGLETHREAAKQWLARHALRTEIDDILITNGGAHGMFLALASVASTNDVVLCEGITDHGIIGISQVLGFTLKGVETDHHGIDPEHFEHLCSNERITALICTPNLNNPTTTLMPDSRRREIAKIARHFGVYVIEHDIFGPLVGERHVAPISHYLPELSFYCTSMAKSVLTGLRIGYLVIPKKMASRTKSILRVNGWMGSPIIAEIASRWINDGSADALIQMQRTLLSKRHAVINQFFSDYILGQHPHALSAWIGLPAHWELDSLIRALRKKKIAVSPSDPFTVPGVSKPQAVRVCVGVECSLEEMRTSMGIMREIFDRPVCR